MTTQEIRGLVYDFLTGCGGNTPAQIAAYIGDDALIDEMLDNMTLSPEDIEHVRAVWNEVLDEVKIEQHILGEFDTIEDAEAFIRGTR